MLMRDEGKDLRAAEKLLNHTLRNEPFLKHQAGLFSILLFELADTHLMLGDYPERGHDLSQGTIRTPAHLACMTVYAPG